ncbi:hypothetical protein RHGRI_003792 [Rhododendron griersonianum]|uniref:Uncharacterized protein n=1 Tax=Rhododendron griersonianum TaxID=479676 RepID=A0AAV6L6P8_9ERIC|nr:hypothetical protein RHGRI_003792 [Rhododendron griersonianum]
MNTLEREREGEEEKPDLRRTRRCDPSRTSRNTPLSLSLFDHPPSPSLSLCGSERQSRVFLKFHFYVSDLPACMSLLVLIFLVMEDEEEQGSTDFIGSCPEIEGQRFWSQYNDLVMIIVLGITNRNAKGCGKIYLLEKVVLHIIAALGASVAFLDMIILLRDARNANSTPYHEGLFRGYCSPCLKVWQLVWYFLQPNLVLLVYWPFVS